MNPTKIEYSDGKRQFFGELFVTAAGGEKRPGIVVFPEAFGLNDHTRQHAQRLADMGYVALAADYHGEGQLFGDMPSLMPRLQELQADRADWRGRAQAALDTLAKQPQVDGAKMAAIGFCFGGATCLELARTGASLAAIVTFHAAPSPELPGDGGQIRGKVLICHGADDPLVAGEKIDAVVAELRRDRVDWQLSYYGNAGHSFTNTEVDKMNVPGLAYNAAASRRSWAAMSQLFSETFG